MQWKNPVEVVPSQHESSKLISMRCMVGMSWVMYRLYAVIQSLEEKLSKAKKTVTYLQSRERKNENKSIVALNVDNESNDLDEGTGQQIEKSTIKNESNGKEQSNSTIKTAAAANVSLLC